MEFIKVMQSGSIRWRRAALGLLGLLAVGCSQQVELAYAPRSDLKDAPAKHQQQIGEALAAYFGTPRFPNFMEPAPAEKQPAEAEKPLLVDRLDRRVLEHGREVYTR